MGASRVTVRKRVPVREVTLLKRLARQSETGEHYEPVARGERHRLGLVVTAARQDPFRFSIELLVSVFRTQAEVQPPALDQAARLSRILARRGYAMGRQDDGWILCERTVNEADVPGECAFLVSCLEDILGPRRARARRRA